MLKVQGELTSLHEMTSLYHTANDDWVELIVTWRNLRAILGLVESPLTKMCFIQLHMNEAIEQIAVADGLLLARSNAGSGYLL